MNADLSRRVGIILGKSRPAPTSQEREDVIKALETAQTWGQLPTRIRQMLNHMVRTTNQR